MPSDEGSQTDLPTQKPVTEITENDAAAIFLGSKLLCGPEGEGREDRNASRRKRTLFPKRPAQMQEHAHQNGLTSSHARSSHRATARTWEISQFAGFASSEIFEIPAYVESLVQ